MAYSINDAAVLLGLHPKTLRRWEDKKKFVPKRTLGNQRRFSDKDIAALRAIKEGKAEPVIYDRILSLENAARKLSVSPDTVRRWTKQGRLALTVNDELQPGYSEKALDKLTQPQAKPVSPTPVKPTPPLFTSTFPIPTKFQKPFIYATLTTMLATVGILAYILINKPPFLANPSVEQLDLTPEIEVALPRTASFLDGHITIGTDSGDFSFLDKNANFYVKNQALIEGSVNTGSIQLLPGEQPESQIGRIYVSQDSGDLLYFDGLEWTSLNDATKSASGQPSLSGVYQGPDIDITLGNPSTTLGATPSATSLKLTLAGSASAFQILGGAGQELATFDDDALYPVTISQPTQVIANLYARQLVDSDNINYYLDPANSAVSLAVAGDATVSGTITFSKNGEYLTNSINDYLIASGGLTVGGSTGFGIGPTGHANFKKGNFEETLTASAAFDANAQVDLGDGGDTITLNGSTITITGNTTTDGTWYLPDAYSSTTADAANVFIDSAGQLYRSTSSQEYKQNISDLNFDLDKLMALRPVSYQMNEKTAFAGQTDLGLIAEEVYQLYPEIVVLESGTDKINTLEYGKVGVLALQLAQYNQKELRELKSVLNPLAGTIIGNADSPMFEIWDEFIKNLTVEQKIISPVVETKKLSTNFISPLIESEPITIDADVTISGTLTADQIESSTITNLRDKIADLAAFYREQTATAAATTADPVTEDLAAQLLTPSASDSAMPDGRQAYMTVENLEAKAGFFSEYLAVIGQATLTDVKINNLLTVNSITSANGAINFLAGLMTLDATGKIYINGDVNIAGSLAVSDTIIASRIAPPPETDLSIKIASQSAVSIYNLIDSDAVASIDASGSGSFSRLNLKASGTATISAGLNSVAVPSEQLNPNSQVIITFTSNYSPATKYWVTKEPELKLFNVFVNYPVNEETTLDWLLIN